SVLNADDVDEDIIIGDAAIGIAQAAFDKGIGFGPVRLDVASGDRRNPAEAAEFTGIASEQERVAIRQAEARGVLGVHQDVIAAGAGQRVSIALDHAVELLASAGREAKDGVICRAVLNFYGREPGASIGCRKILGAIARGPDLLAKSGASPLDLVAG